MDLNCTNILGMVRIILWEFLISVRKIAVAVMFDYANPQYVLKSRGLICTFLE